MRHLVLFACAVAASAITASRVDAETVFRAPGLDAGRFQYLLMDTKLLEYR